MPIEENKKIDLIVNSNADILEMLEPDSNTSLLAFSQIIAALMAYYQISDKDRSDIYGDIEEIYNKTVNILSFESMEAH